jgi:energy-converting hydrogenase A subunit M
MTEAERAERQLALEKIEREMGLAWLVDAVGELVWNAYSEADNAGDGTRAWHLEDAGHSMDEAARHVREAGDGR